MGAGTGYSEPDAQGSSGEEEERAAPSPDNRETHVASVYMWVPVWSA